MNRVHCGQGNEGVPSFGLRSEYSGWLRRSWAHLYRGSLINNFARDNKRCRVVPNVDQSFTPRCKSAGATSRVSLNFDRFGPRNVYAMSVVWWFVPFTLR
jgi:hypothetical protein